VTKSLPTLGLVLAFALAWTALAFAQDRPAATPNTALVVMPLKIQVVISRYQGDKKISSLPYSLSVSGGGGRMDPTAGPAFVGRANLRMGTKVPVPVTTFGPADKSPGAVQSYQYQDVGTNIDCQVWAVDESRFRVEITIDDSSVYPDESKEPAGAVKGAPSLRSFRASDAMMLKDGGTAQFTAATDKVSGETVRVDVTLTVIK